MEESLGKIRTNSYTNKVDNLTFIQSICYSNRNLAHGQELRKKPPSKSALIITQVYPLNCKAEEVNILH